MKKSLCEEGKIFSEKLNNICGTPNRTGYLCCTNNSVISEQNFQLDNHFETHTIKNSQPNQEKRIENINRSINSTVISNKVLSSLSQNNQIQVKQDDEVYVEWWSPCTSKHSVSNIFETSIPNVQNESQEFEFSNHYRIQLDRLNQRTNTEISTPSKDTNSLDHFNDNLGRENFNKGNSEDLLCQPMKSVSSSFEPESIVHTCKRAAKFGKNMMPDESMEKFNPHTQFSLKETNLKSILKGSLFAATNKLHLQKN